MYNKFFATVFIGIALMSNTIADDGIVSGRVVNDGGEVEAGVWVIAETNDLPTDYRKIVVTDANGRFVIPELPPAQYRLWVRGYGLVDSNKIAAIHGADATLTVSRAINPVLAARVFPSNYWLSLVHPPAADSFGTATAPYTSQASWLSQLKLNCVLCHQLGNQTTRLPNAKAFDHGFKKSSGMNYFADALGRERLLSVLGDWGERIRAGEVPESPPRPTGIERNVVITQWGWGDNYTYAHDEIATDKRSPMVNANGPIYGVDIGNDYLMTVDPNTHTASREKVPTRGEFDTPWCEQTHKSLDSAEINHFGFGSLGCPATGGETPHAGRYDNPANPHNPMMDADGRIWMTTQIRRQWDADAPAFCREADVIKRNLHHRQLAYFDTASREYVMIDTCFGTHHLQFDNQGILWLSGDNYVIGWFDPAKFDRNDPTSLARAQSWSEVKIDSNGDTRADQPIVGFHYGVIPNPVDSSVWTAIPPGISSPSGERGKLHRYDPSSGTHEVYAPPAPGFGPRGVDVDSKGIIWTALAGSGHVARFDRSKCRQHWGTGSQCAAGWTLWQSPGPDFSGMESEANNGSTDMHYYLWVDQFNTLGMGTDMVVLNGTGSDALLVFDPVEEHFTTIRIPYPLNSYTRGLDGRIDDPNAGWKGRGLWFTNGLDPIIHSEIPKSYVGRVQLRPHPLAY